MNTSTYLVRALESYGVDTLFGIPGVHTLEVYRALADSSIQHISPRHEQAAGFMADGYARASGKVGVCLVITGPGVTNTLTAMSQAYGDSIPMLVISTVNSHGRMGSGEGWLHELPNQQAMVSEVTSFSRTIHHADELAPALAQAFALFDSARPRPVHIEIPINVLSHTLEKTSFTNTPTRTSRAVVPQAQIADIALQLSQAENPLLLVGGGAKHAIKLARLAEAIDAPVVMTTNARGLLPVDHPLAVSLSASLPETRDLIKDADLILALGTEFGPTDYDMYEDGGFVISARLLRIDIDPQQLFRGPSATQPFVGDAALAVEALLTERAISECATNEQTVDDPATSEQAISRTSAGATRAALARQGLNRLSESMRGDLHLLNLMRDALPDALLVGDSTQLTYAGNLGFSAATPASYFNSATGFGTLGYALPAAIGACFGTQRPVLALTGDGGLQFVLAELVSAVEAQVPLIMIVHDNQGYGEIKTYMNQQNVAPIGVDILTPELSTIAAACGWMVHTLGTGSGLPELLKKLRHCQSPQLLLLDDFVRKQSSQAVCEP